ncbi:kinetochore-associated Ndc80 complex subunit nuf2 [Marasmius tenuissimus]|uniref:Kinetochore-associated Ndc80 complex subunit nuf2 n=1 Tax=Marasmius tenuissimus TaxID=585030 RepID=A0ABR2ZEP8_9AGAR|nr:kinetochore-associated Ndc80 complex subunit nuf2 [Marasmius tenuissimus]
MSSSKKYIYPSLSIDDIISALETWGLSVSPEQLNRPTPEFVEGVYSACLDVVTNINADALNDPVQQCLSASTLDEKEIYTGAVRNALLLHHLSRFAIAARIEDFSALDISRPERDRTLILLSAFINFIRFTDQFCSQRVNKLQHHSNTIIDEHEKVKNKLADVRLQIAEIKAKLAKDEPRCEELRAENNRLMKHLRDTKELQQTSIAEIDRLKAEKQQLQQRKEAFTKEIESVETDIQRVRGRIVQSPERVKRAISTMGNQVSEDKGLVSQNEAKTRELQTKIKVLNNISEDIHGCLDQLQIIEKEAESLEASQRELSDLKAQYEDKEVERNEQRLRQERVAKQLANARQKLENTQARAKEKREANQRAREKLQVEYDQMNVERQQNDKNLQGVREETDAIEAKVVSVA